jgi:VWFA-related protein
MTDGVDNALPLVYGDGSQTTFETLVELVRSQDVLVYPVYLDTEKEDVQAHRTPHSAYAIARAQLAELAYVCGTSVYWAQELKDLDNVYRQVIGDLGTVYSIGYKPSNERKDGKWRTVSVSLPGHQDLLAKTKKGYFARPDAESRNK